jgi:hypothetical protein
LGLCNEVGAYTALDNAPLAQLAEQVTLNH